MKVSHLANVPTVERFIKGRCSSKHFSRCGDIAGIPIRSSIPGELVVSVLDFSGRQVAQHTMDSKIGDATYQLDVSQLPIGFYILKIMQGGYSGYRSMEVVR